MTSQQTAEAGKARLHLQIETLSPACVEEVVDFVEYLKQKQLRKIPETMLLSESALAKDWLSPEEDEAWANL